LKTYLKGMDLSEWDDSTELQAIIDMFADKVDEIAGTAWREATATDERHSIKRSTQASVWWERTFSIHLNHENIRDITKLEIWEGDAYVDWVATKTLGRDGDYWIDKENGIIYLYTFYWIKWGNDAKVTYTHGATTVDPRAKELNLVLSAIHILENFAHLVAIPEGPGQNPLERRLGRMKDRQMDLEGQLVGWKIVDEGDWE
jgi:hypothetical protein